MFKIKGYWFKVVPYKVSRSAGEPGLESVEFSPVNWLSKFGTWIAKWGKWSVDFKYMDRSWIECSDCKKKFAAIDENIIQVECPKCHTRYTKQKVTLAEIEVKPDAFFHN